MEPTRQVLERADGEGPGGLADQDLAGSGGRLQTRGEIDDGADRRELTVLG